MMKRISFSLLLIIPVSLMAVVSLGDDYIGLSEMGMYRKHYQGESSDHYGGWVSYSQAYYFYDQDIPTRLDSIIGSNSSNEYSSGYVSRYFYNTFPDYEEMIVETWVSDWYGPGLYLDSITTTRLNLSGYIIEWIDDTDYQPTRIVYTYDPANNLISETEYRLDLSTIAPYRVQNHSYDAQNRLIQTEWILLNEIIANRWQSWSEHPLPDSIYIDQPTTTPMIMIYKHQFYPNEELSHKSQISKYDIYSTTWSRYDYSYSYENYGEMIFPSQVVTQSGSVGSPDSAFTPSHTYTTTYNYSNNYHSINEESSSYHRGFQYNDNWLLTSSSSYSDGSISGKSITWEYYGSTSDQDLLTPVPQIYSFPNPGKDLITIRLEQQKVSPSTNARIFNARGQLVRSLAPQQGSGTFQQYSWDCRDDGDLPVPSGIYLIKLDTRSGTVSRRVTVLR